MNFVGSIKKYLVSSALIASFIFYAIFQRSNDTAVKKQIGNFSVENKASDINPTIVYKDGIFTGNSVNVDYGNVQVQAVIKNGKIADIKFLEFPTNHKYSAEVSAYSTPILRTEAIQVQSANVDVVSGATATSSGFIESLASALILAKK